MSALEIRQFPCLSDNYGYLIHDRASGETATIDTPDAAEILRQAEKAGWRITQIWNTHHHFDHAGGNAAIVAATGAKVTGPAGETDRIPGIDRPVVENDRVALGGRMARVIDTPGHTSGHIIYHFADEAAAFVGDTLFALGCGRLFEGTPEQMWRSLCKLKAMPGETKIYCAHEYTQANARFALSVDPQNPALQAYAAQVDAERARGEPTVPTTIDAELDANPFLRADDPALRQYLGLSEASDVEVFAEVRRRKDQF